MLLTEVATFLASNVTDTALTAGTNLFASKLPNDPDVAVAVYELTSGPPEYVHGGDGGPWAERPRLQCYVRHTNYADGRDLANDVWRKLQTIANQDLSGVRYHRCQAVTSVNFLRFDELDRPVFTMNMSIWKAPS